MKKVKRIILLRSKKLRLNPSSTFLLVILQTFQSKYWKVKEETSPVIARTEMFLKVNISGFFIVLFNIGQV